MRKSGFLILPAVAAAWLLSSCSRTDARGVQAAEIPTVAVAQAQTEDLSRGIVLTAEFKPFQEVDVMAKVAGYIKEIRVCLLYTSPSPRDGLLSRMPSSA